MKNAHLLLTLMLVVSFAWTGQAQEADKQAGAKPAKPAKEKAAKPTTDPDIQKCIDEKVAKAPSLKDKKPDVTVLNGVVTITGEAKNPGTKGAATRIANSCGAREVKNGMTVAEGIKKPAEKKM